MKVGTIFNLGMVERRAVGVNPNPTQHDLIVMAIDGVLPVKCGNCKNDLIRHPSRRVLDMCKVCKPRGSNENLAGILRISCGVIYLDTVPKNSNIGIPGKTPLADHKNSAVRRHFAPADTE